MVVGGVVHFSAFFVRMSRRSWWGKLMVVAEHSERWRERPFEQMGDMGVLHRFARGRGLDR